MNKPLKILMLEDSSEDIHFIERELKRGEIDFTSCVVTQKEQYQRALQDFRPDIILCDHSLPQFNSIEAMHLRNRFQDSHDVSIPFILITGSVSEEFAVQIMKAGADDYILKDRLKRLPSAIKNAAEKAQLEKERMNHISEITVQSGLMREAEHLANLGCWKVDLITGKHQWSDEAFRMLGFSPGGIHPNYENFRRHVHPDDEQSLTFMLTDAITGEPIRECEFRIIDSEDRIKTIQAKIVVKRDSEQRAYQLIGFTLDVSRLRLQRRALEIQNEKLMEIGREQSHEVRAPLARIIGLIHLVKSYPDDSADLQKALNFIVESAKELDDIIRNIVPQTENIVNPPVESLKAN